MNQIKTRTKLIIAFITILFAICLFNNKTVNAVEVTQEMLDIIPNEITLDIPEIEYEKADQLIEKKVKEILQNNNISIERISVYGTKFYYYGDIHTADINLNGTINKKVSVSYSNSSQRNITDEQYVKNLISKVKSPKYYEVDLGYCSSIENFNDYLKMIENSYTKQINNNSIVVKATAGAGGTDGALNVWTWESGTWIGIFKNGILYETKKMGNELSVPVINVPNTVSKNEVEDYIINLIKKNHKEFGENITKIEKGTKNKYTYCNLDFDIPNGYTIYNKYIELPSYVIINGVDNIEDSTNNTSNIASTDSNTNIKLEATDGVIPSNTILEVAPITEGTTFDRVKNAISNVSKFKVFDINLLSNGVKIQPNGNVKISIPIPENFDTSKLVVYRVEENGNKIEYKVTVEGNYATFETDHFSTYVLAEEETKQGEKDDTPKTGIENDNTITYAVGIIAVFGIAILIINRKNI